MKRRRSIMNGYTELASVKFKREIKHRQQRGVAVNLGLDTVAVELDRKPKVSKLSSVEIVL